MQKLRCNSMPRKPECEACMRPKRLLSNTNSIGVDIHQRSKMVNYFMNASHCCKALSSSRNSADSQGNEVRGDFDPVVACLLMTGDKSEIKLKVSCVHQRTSRQGTSNTMLAIVLRANLWSRLILVLAPEQICSAPFTARKQTMIQESSNQ